MQFCFSFFKMSLIKIALMSMITGKFIVIEGIDRSGKTTLLKNVIDKFNLKYPFRKIKDIHYPDRSTETGTILDKYLRKEIQLEEHVSHLLFSANRWQKDQMVRDLLKDHIVLSSRYYFSGIAYSIAALNIDPNWAKHPDFGLKEPDLLIFLDVTVDLTCKRDQFGTEVYDNQKTQLNIYNQLKNECMQHKNCKILPGLGGFNDLADKVLTLIEEILD